MIAKPRYSIILKLDFCLDVKFNFLAYFYMEKLIQKLCISCPSINCVIGYCFWPTKILIAKWRDRFKWKYSSSLMSFYPLTNESLFSTFLEHSQFFYDYYMYEGVNHKSPSPLLNPLLFLSVPRFEFLFRVNSHKD